MTMHHAFVGGLLEHTVSLIGLGRAVVAHYPELDADVLLAGIVLHDIGKIDELSYERATSYTTAGRLLGHITIGTLHGARKDQGDSGFSGAAGDFDRTFDFEPSRHVRIWLAFVAADARSHCAAFSGRYGFEDGGHARDAWKARRAAKNGPSAIRRCTGALLRTDRFLGANDAGHSAETAAGNSSQQPRTASGGPRNPGGAR